MSLPKGFLGAALWGVLAGWGLLAPVLWWLTPLGVGLWLVQLLEERSFKKVFYSGWVFGISKILVSLVWFWSVYPAQWQGLEPGLFQILMIALFWGPAAITLGLGIALAAQAVVWLRQYLTDIWLVVIAPFVWVLGEIVGAYIFSFYTLGPGSYLTPGFSFGQVGYSLVEHGLFFELARISGVYSLSYVLIFFVLVFIFIKTRKEIFVAVVFLFLISSFIRFSDPINHDTSHTIALVGTNFPAQQNLSELDYKRIELEKFSIVKAALLTDATHIVLPEDYRFTQYFGNPEETLDYLELISAEPKILIDTSRFEIDGEVRLRSFVYDTGAGEFYAFDKQYLVPQGEYIPYVYKWLIGLMPTDVQTDRVLEETAYHPGVNQNTLDLPDTVPSVLFCFESVDPSGVRSIKREDSGLPIIHTISHKWFLHNQGLLWNQLDAMLMTQAKYNETPILQAANEAPVKIIYPDGRIIYPKETEKFRNGAVYIVEI